MPEMRDRLTSGDRMPNVVIHTFSTVDSALFVWFSGAGPDANTGRLLLDGTIRGHKEHKGGEQTLVTRCKVVEA